MLADFDKDGKLDAILVGGTSQGTAAAAYLPGKGDGTFRQPQTYTIDYASRFYLPAEVVGDLTATATPMSLPRTDWPQRCPCC